MNQRQTITTNELITRYGQTVKAEAETIQNILAGDIAEREFERGVKIFIALKTKPNRALDDYYNKITGAGVSKAGKIFLIKKLYEFFRQFKRSDYLPIIEVLETFLKAVQASKMIN